MGPEIIRGCEYAIAEAKRNIKGVSRFFIADVLDAQGK
jgi:hypothetical protein